MKRFVRNSATIFSNVPISAEHLEKRYSPVRRFVADFFDRRDAARGVHSGNSAGNTFVRLAWASRVSDVCAPGMANPFRLDGMGNAPGASLLLRRRGRASPVFRRKPARAAALLSLPLGDDA